MTGRGAELLRRLAAGFLIGDGGTGAMLRASGLSSEDCEEEWNVSHPDAVIAVHRAFREAGSDIVQTNTFQGSRTKLAKRGLGEQTGELNTAGARLTREAVGEDGFVAGSIGPTSELLEPYGPLTVQQAYDAFAEQTEALAAGGVDLFIVETFIALEEIESAIRAAKSTGLPVAASMTFEANGRTIMGVPAERAAVALRECGADIAGANCSLGPQQLEPIVARMAKASPGLLIAQPNAGMPQLVGGRTVYPETPEAMAKYAVRFRELGVNLIGGCCGTRPEHIRAMVAGLRG